MNLNDLGLLHQTDKASDHHDYLKIYERYLERLRGSFVVLLEIGIGGYEYPDRGGQSLRMWYDYFQHGRIVGVDRFEKIGMANDRTHVFIGSQDDPVFLADVVKQVGNPNIIIDDGSHICPLTIFTFMILFPLLAPGGIYICEDVHTSYWPEYKGRKVPGANGTTIQFFKDLTDQLNHEVLEPIFRQQQYAGKIEYIHFYKELVIIKKL